MLRRFASAISPVAAAARVTLWCLTATTASAQVAPAPIAWFRGEGDTNDSAGAWHGTAMGAPGYRAGIDGQAFSFDGFDDWVRLPSGLSPSTDFSVELWVRFDDISAPAGAPRTCWSPGCDMTLIADQFGVNGTGWRIIKQSDNRIWLLVSCGCPTVASTEINPGNWHQVVATFENWSGPTATVSLHLDGVLQGSTNVTPGINPSTDFRLGSYLEPAFLYGALDEVRIFDVALEPATVAQIYAARTSGRPSVDARFDFDVPGLLPTSHPDGWYYPIGQDPSPLFTVAPTTFGGNTLGVLQQRTSTASPAHRCFALGNVSGWSGSNAVFFPNRDTHLVARVRVWNVTGRYGVYLQTYHALGLDTIAWTSTGVDVGDTAGWQSIALDTGTDYHTYHYAAYVDGTYSFSIDGVTRASGTRRPRPSTWTPAISGADWGRDSTHGGDADWDYIHIWQSEPADDVTVIGTGCAGTGGRVPELAAVGEPTLGNPSFGLSLTDARPHAAVIDLFAGATATTALGGGCVLHLDGPVSSFVRYVGGNGQGTFVFGVPNDVNLVGLEAFFQSAVFDPNGSFGGVVAFSNGLRVRVGD